jgi:hypothetical protein
MSITPDHRPIAPVPYHRAPTHPDQVGTLVGLRAACDITGLPARAILGAVEGGEVRAFRRRFTVVVVLEDVKKLPLLTRKTSPAVAR